MSWRPVALAAGLVGTAVGTGVSIVGGGLKFAQKVGEAVEAVGEAVGEAASAVASAAATAMSAPEELPAKAAPTIGAGSYGARLFVLGYFAYVVLGPVRRRSAAGAARPAAGQGPRAAHADHGKDANRAIMQERIARRVQTWAAANNHYLPSMLNDIIARLSLPSLRTLPPGASPEEVKRTYKRLLVRIHPDKVGQASEAEYLEATETFKVLLAAYRTSFADL